MDQKYRSTQIFSVSQRQSRQIQQLPPKSVSSHSIRQNSSNMNLSRNVSCKVSPGNELSNLEQSWDYELLHDQQHKRISKKKQQYAHMIGLAAKVIGCCLVSLFVLGGFASLVVGLILINQKSTATTTTMSTGTTAVPRIMFSSSQVVDTATILCASTDNSNITYTQCNGLQKNGMYGAGDTSGVPGWSATLSLEWSATVFCQMFLNSSGATFLADYQYSFSSQTRFKWSIGTWSTISGKPYTANLRCFY